MTNQTQSIEEQNKNNAELRLGLTPSGNDYYERHQLYFKVKKQINFKERIKNIAEKLGYKINEDQIFKENNHYKFDIINHNNHTYGVGGENWNGYVLKNKNKEILTYRDYVSWDTSSDDFTDNTNEEALLVEADLEDRLANESFKIITDFFKENKGTLNLGIYDSKKNYQIIK